MSPMGREIEQVLVICMLWILDMTLRDRDLRVTLGLRIQQALIFPMFTDKWTLGITAMSSVPIFLAGMFWVA
jgi:hypothetical protein